MAASDRVTQAGFASSPSGLSPLTLPIERTEDHSPPEEVDQDPRFSSQFSAAWLIAFIAGLIGLWALRKGSTYLQSNAIAVNAFNFLAVGIMAILGIMFFKIGRAHV